MDAPAIEIPADLRPYDGRFGSGPSKVRPSAVDDLAAVAPTWLGTSHRRDAVRDVVGRVRRGLAELFGLPAGYEVLLGNGGSTLFWDAAAFGLVAQRSAHLVIGEFSAKFADVTRAAPHLDDPSVTETAPGDRPHTLDDTAGADAYCYPHNETSTGVVVPLHRPGGDPLVLVDATSAAGGMRVDPAAFDVYYFAPQKCFASDGGLWLACCSPAAIERIERIRTEGRWVPPMLNLGLALDNSRLDQTYNTPALATLFLLERQIAWMLDGGGLEFAAGRCDASSGTVYGWAEAHPLAAPFVADADSRSPVTATIDFADSVDAAVLATVLRANGIVDVEPYRKLGRNQLRIACFPAIEPTDIERLTASVDYVLERLAD